MNALDLRLSRVQRRRRCPLQPGLAGPSDGGVRQVQPLLGKGMDLSEAGDWLAFFVACWVVLVAIAIYFLIRR